VADAMIVEVVSPERVIYTGEADTVILRTQDCGEIAFQAGHASFLGALVEHHARIFEVGGNVLDLAVHRGFVEVSGTPTKVSILSDAAEVADDIDIERAKEALERHLLTIKLEESSEAVADAFAGRARAQARLTATGTSFTA
jgi:F-type H+-transporting ATPase subunit epsilon